MKRKLKRPSCAFSAVLSSMATPPAATAGVVLFDVEETGRDVDEVVAGVRGVTDDLVGAGVESADVLDSAFIFFTCVGRLLDDVDAVTGTGASPFTCRQRLPPLALWDNAGGRLHFRDRPSER